MDQAQTSQMQHPVYAPPLEQKKDDLELIGERLHVV